MKYWAVPKIWANQTVYIFGGGPSFPTLLKEVGLSVFAEKRVIGCNDTYRMGSEFVDVCFFGDWAWYLKHRDGEGISSASKDAPYMKACSCLKEFSGLKVTNQQRLMHTKDEGILVVARRDNELCLNEPTQMGWFRNSGAAAVNLAIKMGASTIVMMGFDMKIVGGKQNWYPNHLRGQRNNPGAITRHIQGFQKLYKAVQKECPNVRIFNATEDSGLTFIPHLSIREAISC